MENNKTTVYLMFERFYLPFLLSIRDIALVFSRLNDTVWCGPACGPTHAIGLLCHWYLFIISTIFSFLEMSANEKLG